ncbi:MAG: TIGR00725 family protein [Thermoprotei archaeon]|nr:MAG: TIGR00725 family protein [Thermoprotei archaeon]HDD63552.1 TIGR00725 family protein [Thermoprotei archaeon]
MRSKIYITVIGSSKDISPKVYELAEKVGFEIAKRGAILVCGGRGGVMEAVAKGARIAGGITVGILPGVSRGEANQYIDIVIPTGMGHGRNFLNIVAGDGVIAISGGAGTLSEIGLAIAYGKPVVVIKGSGGVADLLAGKNIGGTYIDFAHTPEEAVEKLISLIKLNQNR